MSGPLWCLEVATCLCMPADRCFNVHGVIELLAPSNLCICALFKTALLDMQGEGVDAEEEISFVYRKQRFVYNEEAHCFKKLEFPVEVCSCQLEFCFHNCNAEDSGSRWGVKSKHDCCSVHAAQASDSACRKLSKPSAHNAALLPHRSISQLMPPAQATQVRAGS